MIKPSNPGVSGVPNNPSHHWFVRPEAVDKTPSTTDDLPAQTQPDRPVIGVTGLGTVQLQRTTHRITDLALLVELSQGM
jgi:hypothetical protein